MPVYKIKEGTYYVRREGYTHFDEFEGGFIPDKTLDAGFWCGEEFVNCIPKHVEPALNRLAYKMYIEGILYALKNSTIDIRDGHARLNLYDEHLGVFCAPIEVFVFSDDNSAALGTLASVQIKNLDTDSERAFIDCPLPNNEAFKNQVFPEESRMHDVERQPPVSIIPINLQQVLDSAMELAKSVFEQNPDSFK